jgi:hypothetical protein
MKRYQRSFLFILSVVAAYSFGANALRTITVINNNDDGLNLFYMVDSLLPSYHNKMDSVSAKGKSDYDAHRIPEEGYYKNDAKMPESGQMFEWIIKIEAHETAKNLPVKPKSQIIAIPLGATTTPEDLDSLHFANIPKAFLRPGGGEIWKPRFDWICIDDSAAVGIGMKKWIKKK